MFLTLASVTLLQIPSNCSLATSFQSFPLISPSLTPATCCIMSPPPPCPGLVSGTDMRASSSMYLMTSARTGSWSRTASLRYFLSRRSCSLRKALRPYILRHSPSQVRWKISSQTWASHLVIFRRSPGSTFSQAFPSPSFCHSPASVRLVHGGSSTRGPTRTRKS